MCRVLKPSFTVVLIIIFCVSASDVDQFFRSKSRELGVTVVAIKELDIAVRKFGQSIGRYIEPVTDSYKPTLYWWESVDMVKAVGLTVHCMHSRHGTPVSLSMIKVAAWNAARRSESWFSSEYRCSRSFNTVQPCARLQWRLWRLASALGKQKNGRTRCRSTTHSGC